MPGKKNQNKNATRLKFGLQDDKKAWGSATQMYNEYKKIKYNLAKKSRKTITCDEGRMLSETGDESFMIGNVIESSYG